MRNSFALLIKINVKHIFQRTIVSLCFSSYVSLLDGCVTCWVINDLNTKKLYKCDTRKKQNHVFINDLILGKVCVAESAMNAMLV